MTISYGRVRGSLEPSCSSLRGAVALAIGIQLLASAPLQAAESADTVDVLPAVQVEGQAENEGTTEGTGAYTATSTGTATGLGLSPRETPQSVSVVTRERIEDQGLESLTDVVNNVTGVSAKALDSSRDRYSARGFSIDNIMIDGIPTTWSSGWSAGETQSSTVMYDRVEVVRGATGLTTGAGNPSAALNLIRKHADSRVLTGSVSAGVGSWDKYTTTGDITTPLTDSGNVRLRVVGSYENSESFVDLLEDETTVVYGVLDADLTPATRLSVGASRQDNEPTGSMWGGLPTWYSDGTRTDWDRDKTTAADWSSWASVHETLFAELRHRFDSGWTLRAIASQGENLGDLRLLYLSGQPDRVTGLGMGASPSRYDTERKQDDVGVHITGPFALFEREHELTAGVMYSEQDFVAYGYNRAAPPAPGDFNNWDGSYPEPVWLDRFVSEKFVTTQLGVYAAARFNVTDALKVIVGSRVSSWEKDGDAAAYNVAYKIEHDNVVSPYAGVIYDLDDTYSVYASYSDIFNPQNNRDAKGDYLDPLEGANYETGIKGEYLQGRLNASLAVFLVEQDNLAQVDPGKLVPGTTSQAYREAEGTTSEGYELEVSGQLAAGWDISAGWTQFRAEDADGNDVNTDHPRRMLKTFTRYRLPGDWNKLVIGGGVNWESRNYTDVTNPVTGNPERLEQKAYALVNVMARYEFTNALSAQLNVDNVLDETHYSQIGFYNQYSYGEPRNAMLTVNYRY